MTWRVVTRKNQHGVQAVFLTNDRGLCFVPQAHELNLPAALQQYAEQARKFADLANNKVAAQPRANLKRG